VLQQPACGGQAHEGARLQPHEQIDENVVGQAQQTPTALSLRRRHPEPFMAKTIFFCF
jgi:hypothetical protein